MSAPDFLNPDGTVSMASVFLMAHYGLRRDAGRLVRALSETPVRVESVREGWKLFHETLHGHHEAEDTRMFPGLRGQNPGLGEVFDGLSNDHRQLDALLARADAAVGALPAQPEIAATAIAAVRELLQRHLATEEGAVIPILRHVPVVFPPLPEAELPKMADGFAWSTEGIAGEITAPAFAALPEAVRTMLDGAIAAQAEKSRRLWGTVAPAVARRAEPEAA